jgi:ribosome-binding protein aMBF1 (putative translation factor)
MKGPCVEDEATWLFGGFRDELDGQKDERKSLLSKAVGDLVRTQRKNRGKEMTQEELAFRSGISYEHLNHIENHKAMASVEVLDRIACALGFQRLSDFLACDASKIL